jgi:folate-binding protein YgfZ
VAEHFGDPFREQRALALGDAVVVRDDCGVIRLSGRDRLTWLDSLVSQEVSALGAGESAEALLLDPNGRIERVMRIIDDGTNSWILVDRDAAGLASWFDRMVFRRDVDVADVSDEFTVVGFFDGGCATSALAPLTVAPNGVPLTWVDPWSALVAGGWQYSSPTGHPGAAWTYREALLDAAAPTPELPESAGTLALTALRVAAWRPALADVDETSLPHEFDWLRSAVHLSKGCYRGQETVAKVHNLGHPPRRFVALDLDGSDSILPEPGCTVALAEDPEKSVGHITSAVRHFEEGPIALALVKRSVPADAALVVRASDASVIAARQTTIVPSDAGKTLDVPRIKRDRVRPTRS